MFFQKRWVSLLENNVQQGQLSNEKRAPGWLGYIGDILPSYIGITINHYKDPY